MSQENYSIAGNDSGSAHATYDANQDGIVKAADELHALIQAGPSILAEEVFVRLHAGYGGTRPIYGV